jgi:hypothetical protein
MSSWSALSPFLKKPRKENTISITTCINFADKLRDTIEINSLYFKKLYIVTDPSDKDTIELCKGFKNVGLIFCSDIHKNNAKFNKSGLINFAQSKIYPYHGDDWIVLIDADTIVPQNFWTETIREEQYFSKHTIYLLKRKIYLSNEDLIADKYSEIQHGCGFFQLYFSKNKFYGDFSENASVCDIVFQHLFRNQKELLGYCIHLGQSALDWDGRKSEKWT